MADRAINILVVDDSIQCRKHLERILLLEGYSVVLAENGEDAVQIIKNNHFNLILLDIIMPGMDGFEVIKEIHSAPMFYNTPVIFLTGNDDSVSKIKAFDLGAVDYIVKPFNPSEVRARVNVHLRNAIQTNTIICSQAEKLKQIAMVRESMLVKPCDIPEAKFSVVHSAVLEAGGDFYDVMHSSGKRHLYFVADLSGHDIAASYMVPAVKALIKQNSLPIYSIQETLSMMNRVLFEIMEEDKYMTAFYLVVDRALDKIFWEGAGHLPALYIPVAGDPEFLESNGDVIGMFEQARYSSLTKKVSKGDKIVLFTDGLLETGKNSPVWCSKIKDLLGAAKNARNIDISRISQAIFDELVKQEQSEMTDDIIILSTEV